MNGVEEGFSVTDWVSKHVSVTIGSRKGFACHISASAVLPLSAALAYELLTHPLNSKAFRGIDKCAYRRVLSADEGCGRLVVEVENISVWRFLFFSGRIATSLLVHQDYHAGTMNVALDPTRRGIGPRTPGCKQVPLEKLEACWSIKPLSECMGEAQPLLPLLDPDAMERVDENYCYVRLEQSLSPWGIPGFLHGAFKGFARGQVVQTFEDVLAEGDRIRRGFPTLCPYEEVCMKDIMPEEEEEEAQQGEQGSSATSAASGEPDERGSECGTAASSATLATDTDSSSYEGSNHPVAAAAAAGLGLLRRCKSLRGHPILLLDGEDEEWEVGLEVVMDGTESESGLSAAGSYTPFLEEEGCRDDVVQLALAAAAGSTWCNWHWRPPRHG